MKIAAFQAAFRLFAGTSATTCVVLLYAEGREDHLKHNYSYTPEFHVPTFCLGPLFYTFSWQKEQYSRISLTHYFKIKKSKPQSVTWKYCFHA